MTKERLWNTYDNVLTHFKRTLQSSLFCSIIVVWNSIVIMLYRLDSTHSDSKNKLISQNYVNYLQFTFDVPICIKHRIWYDCFLSLTDKRIETQNIKKLYTVISSSKIELFIFENNIIQ